MLRNCKQVITCLELTLTPGRRVTTVGISDHNNFGFAVLMISRSIFNNSIRMKNLLLLSFLSAISSLVFAQSWTPRADLPDSSGRHHPVTWGIDGYGYVSTGTDPFFEPTADFFRYDPLSDQWERLPDFPGVARSFAIGAVYESKGYLGFGASNSAYLGDIWTYDPETGEWEELTTCPCEPRRHPSFLIIEDRLFVGLGDGPTGNLKDWWEFDLNSRQWTQHPDIPGLPRHHPFQFIAGGKVFAGMGHGQGAIYNDWYQFDLNTNTWITMNPFPGEARVAGTQFDHNGYGYVLSGDGSDHNYMDTGEFWKYDPDTDTWQELPPHPGISRWAPGSFVIEDEVFFIGGQNRVDREIKFDMWAFPLEDMTSGQGDKERTAWSGFYPNPAGDVIFFKSTDLLERVTLFNKLGQVIRVWEEPGDQIFIGDIDQGTYLLQRTAANGLFKSDIIIKSH